MRKELPRPSANGGDYRPKRFWRCFAHSCRHSGARASTSRGASTGPVETEKQFMSDQDDLGRGGQKGALGIRCMPSCAVTNALTMSR
jgi:hypothetical protein